VPQSLVRASRHERDAASVDSPYSQIYGTRQRGTDVGGGGGFMDSSVGRTVQCRVVMDDYAWAGMLTRRIAYQETPLKDCPTSPVPWRNVWRTRGQRRQPELDPRHRPPRAVKMGRHCLPPRKLAAKTATASA